MRDSQERYFVYILECSDKSYYTGITSRIEERVLQHQNGDDTTCYTYKRRPIQLVFSEGFREALDAIALEKQIKCWNRKKKEALINNDFESIKNLAKRRTSFKTT
jgi:putative endonuclease